VVAVIVDDPVMYQHQQRLCDCGLLQDIWYYITISN